jgi:hypothetical protein
MAGAVKATNAELFTLSTARAGMVQPNPSADTQLAPSAFSSAGVMQLPFSTTLSADMAQLAGTAHLDLIGINSLTPPAFNDCLARVICDPTGAARNLIGSTSSPLINVNGFQGENPYGINALSTWQQAAFNDCSVRVICDPTGAARNPIGSTSLPLINVNGFQGENPYGTNALGTWQQAAFNDCSVRVICDPTGAARNLIGSTSSPLINVNGAVLINDGVLRTYEPAGVTTFAASAIDSDDVLHTINNPLIPLSSALDAGAPRYSGTLGVNIAGPAFFTAEDALKGAMSPALQAFDPLGTLRPYSEVPPPSYGIIPAMPANDGCEKTR